MSLRELEERVRALELQRTRKEPERDYVYVQEEESDEPTELISSSPTVSIDTMEQWEKELMQDPKVYGS